MKHVTKVRLQQSDKWSLNKSREDVCESQTLNARTTLSRSQCETTQQVHNEHEEHVQVHQISGEAITC